MLAQRIDRKKAVAGTSVVSVGHECRVAAGEAISHDRARSHRAFRN
jgi:hypothetical protein